MSGIKKKHEFKTCAEEFEHKATRAELVHAHQMACKQRLAWKRERNLLLNMISENAVKIAELQLSVYAMKLQAADEVPF
jgi:hypothetical protein